MLKYTLITLLALFTTLASTSNVGDVTSFTPGLGLCGKTNSASDFMVAVSSQFFDSFGPQSKSNPICGRQIEATAPGGKTVTVAVEDKCTSCAMFDLDMSPAAFDKLADPSVKRIDGVTWKLL